MYSFEMGIRKIWHHLEVFNNKFDERSRFQASLHFEDLFFLSTSHIVGHFEVSICSKYSLNTYLYDEASMELLKLHSLKS